MLGHIGSLIAFIHTKATGEMQRFHKKPMNLTRNLPWYPVFLDIQCLQVENLSHASTGTM
jgi:hypothetical protein